MNNNNLLEERSQFVFLIDNDLQEIKDLETIQLGKSEVLDKIHLLAILKSALKNGFLNDVPISIFKEILINVPSVSDFSYVRARAKDGNHWDKITYGIKLNTDDAKESTHPSERVLPPGSSSETSSSSNTPPVVEETPKRTKNTRSKKDNTKITRKSARLAGVEPETLIQGKLNEVKNDEEREQRFIIVSIYETNRQHISTFQIDGVQDGDEMSYEDFLHFVNNVLTSHNLPVITKHATSTSQYDFVLFSKDDLLTWPTSRSMYNRLRLNMASNITLIRHMSRRAFTRSISSSSVVMEFHKTIVMSILEDDNPVRLVGTCGFKYSTYDKSAIDIFYASVASLLLDHFDPDTYEYREQYIYALTPVPEHFDDALRYLNPKSRDIEIHVGVSFKELTNDLPTKSWANILDYNFV